MKAVFRNRLKCLTDDAFFDLLKDINRRLLDLRKIEVGISPKIIAIQRHYPSQRSPSIIDAKLEYDLRTISGDISKNRKTPVKHQPEWWKATYDAYAKKKSNLQLQVGATFSYRECKFLKGKDTVDLFVETWVACKPVIDVMLDK